MLGIITFLPVGACATGEAEMDGQKGVNATGDWLRVPEFGSHIVGSDPHVVHVHGSHLMYTSRRDPTRDVSTIWAWRSTDGLRWQSHGQALDVGPQNSWDATNAEVPSVLYEDGLYRLWYGGAQGITYQIGYAESRDGIRFQRLPAEKSPYGRQGLVLAPDDKIEGSALAVSDPAVIHVHDKYYLYFNGFSVNALAISLATSHDGIHWQRQGVVLRPELPWEMSNKKDGTVVQPSVVHDGDTFHMVYGTFSGVGHDIRAIGYATSDDGVHWSKSSRPILMPERGERFFTGPMLLLTRSWWNLYYSVWWEDAKASDGVRMTVRLARRAASP